MSRRYPAEEGLQFSVESQPWDSAPQLLQPEKEVGISPLVVQTYPEPSPSLFFNNQAIVEKRICGLRRKIFWIVLAVATVAVIVIVSLGAAIGVVSKNNSSNNRSAATRESQDAHVTTTILSVAPLTASSAPQFTVTVTAPSAPAGTPAGSTSPGLVCGTLAKCNATGCSGYNSQATNYGQCQSGTQKGCPCITLCGPILGPCTGCEGVNGTCGALPYAGCGCLE